MIKKTVTYMNFDDEEVTEDFYFHMSKAELMEKQFSTEGGWDKKLKSIVASKNPVELIAMFKEIVLESYGVKTPDGRQFLKSDELRAQFVQHAAYSEIFMELATDDEAAAEFINGVMPDPDTIKDAKENRPVTQDHQQKREPVRDVETVELPDTSELDAFRAWQASQKAPQELAAPTE